MNGIKDEGLVRTIKISYVSLLDYFFDYKYGTDTVRQIEMHDLRIESENWQRGERYALTPAKAFLRCMNNVEFPSESVFVDLGCGKGKMLLLASQFNFKRVVGVEFSKDIYECAKNNITLYKEKTGNGTNIDIVHSDVTEYEIKNDENVFYLFNPFDKVVLAKVIENIRASIERKPREIIIIYYNPVHGIEIEQEIYFVNAKRHMLYGCEFVVYFLNGVR